MQEMHQKKLKAPLGRQQGPDHPQPGRCEEEAVLAFGQRTAVPVREREGLRSLDEGTLDRTFLPRARESCGSNMYANLYGSFNFIRSNMYNRRKRDLILLEKSFQ